MLTNKGKQILKNFAIVIPKLNETQRSELLGLSKGMVMAKSKEETNDEEAEIHCVS